MKAVTRSSSTGPIRTPSRQFGWRAELAVTHADSTPRLDELPVGRELADARRGTALDALGDRVRGDHALCFVTIGHVDAAVGADDDVVRLVELTVGVAGLARDAQAQQLLALRAELVDLMPLGACLVAGEVRDPYVALRVHADAVGRNHDALAEVREHSAGLAIELEDGIDRRAVAVDGTTAGSSRAAALVGPDVAVDGIDVNAGRGAPLAARRQLTPVAGRDRSRVRQSLPGDRIARRHALSVQCRNLRIGAGVDVLRRQEDRSTEAENGHLDS